MIGEVSFHGVFVPTLLVLGLVAALVTVALQRLADLAGFYRIVAYRPAVDLALFVLVFGALGALAPLVGLAP